MPEARAVDRLEVLVLIDNVTDSLSTNPKNVIPEWSGLITGGRMRMMAGTNICCAHHGLSLLITTHIGNEKHTLLFDAGPDGPIFRISCIHEQLFPGNGFQAIWYLRKVIFQVDRGAITKLLPARQTPPTPPPCP